MDSIELELCFGVYTPRNFVPSVSKGAFELIKRGFEAREDYHCTGEESTELVYIPNRQGKQYVCNYHTKSLKRVNAKSLIPWHQDDLALTKNVGYGSIDVHFSLARDSDSKEELVKCQARCGGEGAPFDISLFLPSPGFQYEMHVKKRVSYLDSKGLMRVNLTRVEARTVKNGADISGRCSYEVEVELTPKALSNKEAINYEDVMEIEYYLSKIINVARTPTGLVTSLHAFVTRAMMMPAKRMASSLRCLASPKNFLALCLSTSTAKTSLQLLTPGRTTMCRRRLMANATFCAFSGLARLTS